MLVIGTSQTDSQERRYDESDGHHDCNLGTDTCAAYTGFSAGEWWKRYGKQNDGSSDRVSKIASMNVCLWADEVWEFGNGGF